MSDELMAYRCTFCVILDRNENVEISNNGFFQLAHVTPEDMEMSQITLRIEWKHCRIPAGPASGRNRPLKGRNLGFGHEGTFFQSFEKFEKWEAQNFWLSGERKLYLSGWNRSEVIRGLGGRASLHKGSSPTRTVQLLPILLASYPIFDLAITGP